MASEVNARHSNPFSNRKNAQKKSFRPGTVRGECERRGGVRKL
jgi:hypothetical protein